MEHITQETLGNRLVLIPQNGYYVTNGVIYSKHLILAEGLTEEGFYAITDAEYALILEEQAKEVVSLYTVKDENSSDGWYEGDANSDKTKRI